MVAALFLCIGIAIAPCIKSGISTALIEDDDIAVTVQTYGMKGVGTHSVSLPKQQYQQLERYLVDLMARLNETISTEEAALLLKDAIVEIASYGLLPKGMSVEQAQRLVSGYAQDSKMRPSLGINSHSKGSGRVYGNRNAQWKNVLCFLSAVATKIPDYEPSPVILPFGALLILALLPAFFASLLGNQEQANSLAALGLRVWNANPFRASNFVMILGYDVKLRSVGLLGIVTENLSEGVVLMGYSGLLLFPFDDTTVFLGYALAVLSAS